MPEAHEHNEESHGGGGHGGGGGRGGGGHGGHGPGGGGSHEEHEGAPEWLISFADNVALMMGFFVILLAMNMAKPSSGGIGGEGKYPSNEETPQIQDFVIAMRKAFGNPVDLASNDPKDATLRARMRQKLSQGDSSDTAPDGEKHDVQAPRTSDYVAPVGVVPFDADGASVSPAGKKTAAQVAEQLRGTRTVTEVRGYVSTAEAFRDPDRGMGLAHQRAMAVAHILIESGMRWGQLRVVACADNDPIQRRAENASQHKTNQRVEIIVTQETMPADQFNAGTPGPPAPGGQPAPAPPPADHQK